MDRSKDEDDTVSLESSIWNTVYTVMRVLSHANVGCGVVQYSIYSGVTKNKMGPAKSLPRFGRMHVFRACDEEDDVGMVAVRFAGSVAGRVFSFRVLQST